MNDTTQEIGALKYYSKRKKWASFRADPELWSRFKEECKFRGVSICHVLEALMEAWIQGQKATATVVKPVVVNLKMEHIVQRPRRSQRWPGFEPGEDVAEYIRRFGSCRRLRPSGQFLGKIGWCLWLKRWIYGHECATCLHTGERY